MKITLQVVSCNGRNTRSQTELKQKCLSAAQPTIRRSFTLPSYDAVAQMKALSTNIDLVFFSESSNSVLGSNSITTVLVAYCLLRHLLYFALTIIILWGHLYLSFLYAFVSIFVFVFVLQLDTMEVDTSEACLLAMLGHLASSEAFTNACFASLCSCRHHDRCDLVLRHHGHSQALW